MKIFQPIRLIRKLYRERRELRKALKTLAERLLRSERAVSNYRNKYEGVRYVGN